MSPPRGVWSKSQFANEWENMHISDTNLAIRSPALALKALWITIFACALKFVLIRKFPSETHGVCQGSDGRTRTRNLGHYIALARNVPAEKLPYEPAIFRPIPPIRVVPTPSFNGPLLLWKQPFNANSAEWLLRVGYGRPHRAVIGGVEM